MSELEAVKVRRSVIVPLPDTLSPSEPEPVAAQLAPGVV